MVGAALISKEMTAQMINLTVQIVSVRVMLSIPLPGM